MKRGSLYILVGILVGTLMGAVLGGIYPDFGVGAKFLGDLFLNALMTLVVPLVMCSMVAGVAALGDVRSLGGIGWRTILYYMTTTGLSVLLGLILVNIIRPGSGIDPREKLPDAEWRIERGATAAFLVLPEGTAFRRKFDDRYRLILETPAGPVFALLPGAPTEPGRIRVAAFVDSDGKVVSPPEQGKGVTLEPAIAAKVQGKEESTIWGVLRNVLLGLVPKNLFKAMAETQVLPVIVFALLLGAVLTTLGAKGKLVIEWFEGMNEAILKIIHILMFAAPIGIFALVAGRIGEAGGWEGFLPEIVQVGRYAATVIIGLLGHGIITLPLILFLFGRRNPLGYVVGMFKPLLTAFSTASSSATLPVTLESVEEAGVEPRTAAFVVPLGATINMDGTALYEAVAAMFIAQVYGISMGPAEQVIIFLTATLAAIGAAGIPEAGLVTMVLVLNAVKLPVEGISLLLVIDWFLDRCRTTVNVWGDCVGAAVVDRYEKSET